MDLYTLSSHSVKSIQTKNNNINNNNNYNNLPLNDALSVKVKVLYVFTGTKKTRIANGEKNLPALNF